MRLSMVRSALRVYSGPEDHADLAIAQDPKSVTVTLGEVLHLFADAVMSERTWVNDFADDPITLTEDLYEILFAYQHFRRPSA